MIVDELCEFSIMHDQGGFRSEFDQTVCSFRGGRRNKRGLLWMTSPPYSKALHRLQAHPLSYPPTSSFETKTSRQHKKLVLPLAEDMEIPLHV